MFEQGISPKKARYVRKNRNGAFSLTVDDHNRFLNVSDLLDQLVMCQYFIKLNFLEVDDGQVICSQHSDSD